VLQRVIKFLAGKKTYLVGGIGVLYAFGISRGWWPNESEIWGALGSAGAMTLRAAIANLLKQVAADTAAPSPTPTKTP
jgi:hypothetical protein